MFQATGTRLRLTKGDYGIPLSVHLAPHCDDCGEDMLPTDELELVVERSGVPLITKRTTWERVLGNDGYYTIAFDEDEARGLNTGLYTWRVRLVRDGEVRHTLVTDTLEVVL